MRRRTSRALWLLGGLIGLFCAATLPIIALAALPQGSSATASPAVSAETSERVARLEQQVAEAKSAGDNSWMLVSSALVLLMTGPGLALFYGGLVRKKNVLGTLMQ